MLQYSREGENQLIQVDGTLGTCSSAAACYVYDAEGKRVQKTIGASQTSYLYDLSGHVVAENYGAAWAVGYVYAGGQLIAQYKNSTTYFVHPDHLGSTRLMTSMNQSIYDSMDYLPFGEQIAGDTGATHKFTGKERDPESNLDNFGARYDASSMGRFMSPDPSPMGIDPFDPQSWNLYGYVRNRPIRAIDTNGEWATEIHAEITTYALQDYVSAGELQMLVQEQNVMDSDQSDQSRHAMATRGQAVSQAKAAWQEYVASQMGDVNNDLTPDGNFTSEAVRVLGNAIHTLQDSTSPMHTDSNGDPKVWGGYAPKAWFGDLNHVFGEMSPAQDWSAIKQAMALTMAARLDSHANCEPGKTCLTPQNFGSELNKNFTNYVNSYYLRGEGTLVADPISWDAQRQCGLGNPAACW